jgi:hypothetical protein
LNETELLAAMRLGSRSPSEYRAAGDLGRFGLGLKDGVIFPELSRPMRMAASQPGQLQRFLRMRLKEWQHRNNLA